jgi:hypothetical protein
MKYPFATTSVLVFALALTACATHEKQTAQKSAVTPKGEAAASVTISTVTATVEAIDQATRMLTIVGPEGNAFVMQAGEKVRNLDQVKAGDKIKVEYYEGLVAELNAPGVSPKDVTLTDSMIKAAPGERPAGAVGEAITATVVIEFVDTIRNVVRFKGPLGKSRIVKVEKPEFRTMLKSIKPGDQVTLTYFEAIAIGVEPAN